MVATPSSSPSSIKQQIQYVTSTLESWFLILVNTLSSTNDTTGSNLVDTDSIEEFYNEHCTYFPAMAGWFIMSALLSSYNKFVFGNGHMAFPCPLLLTSIHFAIQWIFSATACYLYPKELGSERIDKMSWKEWITISIPCGAVTSADVGLSNLSMVFITITFYTMVKASTPIFVLGWAYLFGIERITWSLIGVISVIAIGEFLTVVGEVEFVLKGFFLCLSASLLSGARWTLVQLKLQTMDNPIKTTIGTMRLLAPSMFWTMIITSMLIEHPWKTLFVSTNQAILSTTADSAIAGVDSTSASIASSADAVGVTSAEDTSGNSDEDYQIQLLRVFGLGLVGGCIAVMMILCEFYLILHSSAVILMIGGVLKEMITIIIGVSLFGDKLNAINITGCMIVFMGVLLYKLVFHLEKQDKSEHHRQNKEEEVSGLIVRRSDHRQIDDGDSSDVIYPSRGVELLDRNDRSHGLRSKLSSTTEATLRVSRCTSSSDDDFDDEIGLQA